ncbi:MAG: NHL repeat-containing protein [Planctomycetota bacterium]|jgi:hypothetical protein
MVQDLKADDGGGRGLGDLLWLIDLSDLIPGPALGLEFDGTNFWITSPHDFTVSYLYEITPWGALVNLYDQPAGNWGFWGWRDMAFDGTYLYAGDDSSAPGYITQIDPADGQVTGTYYGPYPLSLCRSLAYDPKEDCFWTASFYGLIVKCYRDGTFVEIINPGMALASAATEASDPDHPMIWWLVQDGNGVFAHEYDPALGWTGKFFEIDLGFTMGSPTGACAYDMGGGMWILVVLLGKSLAAFDLDTGSLPLYANKGGVNCWYGDEVDFILDAGAVNADRFFGIFTSLSGSSPGTPLPGGVVLPINWDWFTDLMTNLALSGVSLFPFFDYLDAGGQAVVTMTIPPYINLDDDIPATFAFCLSDPFDYASNSWEVMLLRGR